MTLINTDALISVLRFLLNFSINCALICFIFRGGNVAFCSPSLPVAVDSGEQMEAACSPPPALVLFMQTRGLDIGGGGGEVKRLDPDAHSAAAALHSAEKSLPLIHFSRNNYPVQWRK